MQILFIDESGTPPPVSSPDNSPYFVLGGVVIPEDFWHRIRDDLQHIKNKFDVEGEIKWRFFAPHSKANPLSHLEASQKEDFRSALFSILTKYKSVKLLSVICDAAHAYSKDYVNSPDDLYWYSYKVMTERFQYYLQDISKLSGQTINGIVVCDHRAHDQDRRLKQPALNLNRPKTARKGGDKANEIRARPFGASGRGRARVRLFAFAKTRARRSVVQV